MPTCSRKCFLQKKIGLFLVKMSRFGSFFRNMIWYIADHKESFEKTSRACSKSFLLAFCTTGRRGTCVENIFNEKK